MASTKWRGTAMAVPWRMPSGREIRSLTSQEGNEYPTFHNVILEIPLQK
jgi:hypothetical protein